MSSSMLRRTTPTQLDLSLAAALCALLFMARPLLSSLASGVGDVTSIVAAGIAVPVVLSRIGRAPRIIATSVAFVALYLVSALTTEWVQAGIQHTLAAASAVSALLVFVTYGKDLAASRAFRRCSYVLIAAGLVAVNVSGIPKNASGGAVLYLLALFVAMLVTQPRRRYWPLILGYVAVSAALGFALDFRGLIGYTLILLLAYLGAVTLPRRVFWIVGIVGSISVILATIWYFLNINTNPLAYSVSTLITDASGRRAASGRDWLWPAIINEVGTRNSFLGLGAGILPRDFLPTDLSSHNYFMQTYLQVGWLGLAVLAIVLLAVWKPLAYGSNPAAWFGAAVFLMFVAHNSTEVLMFQNNLIVAIPAWCAIGLMVAHSAPEKAGPPRASKRARKPRHYSSLVR